MKIILCDLSHKREGKFSSEYIPYPIACIMSYFIENYKGENKFSFEIVKDPIQLSKLIEGLLESPEPLVIGFSCYMWNHNLAITYASSIKRLIPSSLVVFGGPDFPLELEEKRRWLCDRSCVDIFVEGEGERPFLSLVEEYSKAGFSVHKENLVNIPSVFAVSDCGELIHSSELGKDGFVKSARIENLDATPSPYTKGYLDTFLAESKLVPLMESNRGCPFTCTFCVDGNAARTKVYKVNPNRLGDELEYIAARYNGSTLALADTNFGMYKEDLVFCKLLEASRKRSGYPKYINTSTGKNQKERIIECAEIVSGALRVAASVQTLDASVLKNIKRSNISSDQLVAMSERLSGGISNTYAELILGLPGDTKEKHIASVEQCLDAGYNQIRMHTLTLLNGSVMGTAEDRDRWQFKTKFRGLQRCFGSYTLLDETMHVIETEEVVISQRSMPFEDYISCRLYNLTVAVFYNEEVFRELLLFVQRKGYKSSDWIYFVFLNISKAKGVVHDLFENFTKMTVMELYEKPSDIIEKFSDDPKFRNDIFQGIAGYNLLLDTQGEILISHFDDLVDTSINLLELFFEENDAKLTNDESSSLRSLGEFISMKRNNIFNVSEESIGHFDSSILPYISLDSTLINEDASTFSARFYFEQDTAKFISDQANTYGTTKEGIGKIIARSPIKDFQRKVAFIESYAKDYENEF
jgi:radical SAM superfamily enzyme YgiQ (UPF0313 family)